MIYIYLYENIIQYMEKEEIKEYIVPKKAMAYGKIINISIFEESLDTLIKKEKWSTLLTTKKITIIEPIHYNKADEEIMTIILNNCGIKHITWQKEETLYTLKNNQIFMNLHDTYLTAIKKKKGKIEKLFIPINIFNSIDAMIKYITENNKETCRYYFLGSNKNIPKIIRKLNNQTLFYFTNSRNYLLNKLIP